MSWVKLQAVHPLQPQSITGRRPTAEHEAPFQEALAPKLGGLDVPRYAQTARATKAERSLTVYQHDCPNDIAEALPE